MRHVAPFSRRSFALHALQGNESRFQNPEERAEGYQPEDPERRPKGDLGLYQRGGKRDKGPREQMSTKVLFFATKYIPHRLLPQFGTITARNGEMDYDVFFNFPTRARQKSGDII